MKATTKNKSWIGGIIAAFAASLCCITPVLAFLGGASGLASSFSWIVPYRPYLIGLTITIFAFAWYQKLKPGKRVDCNCEVNNKRSFWRTKLFLAIITVAAALLIAFPIYAGIFYPRPQQAKIIVVGQSNIQTAQLNILGMDCEGCTAHINGELSKVNGVVEANASFKNKDVIIKFDNSKTSVNSLANMINRMGYKVTSSTTNRK